MTPYDLALFRLLDDSRTQRLCAGGRLDNVAPPLAGRWGATIPREARTIARLSPPTPFPTTEDETQ